MSHEEAIVQAFKRNHWKMELGHILKYPFGHKWSARASDLRRKGYTINCIRGKNPSSNLYVMICPEKDGQLRFA